MIALNPCPSRVRASESSVVSLVLELDTPRCICWPAYTDNRSVPRLSICCCTAFCAPVPRATMVITAATPITMPNAVRKERSLFARMAASAT